MPGGNSHWMSGQYSQNKIVKSQTQILKKIVVFSFSFLLLCSQCVMHPLFFPPTRNVLNSKLHRTNECVCQQ